MRAGIFVAYWPWFTPEEQAALAVLADELGLDSVWVAEAWGQDAVSVLGFLAAKTDRLGLGVSGPQVSEGWYGVPFARPVSRTREYVEIVRRALAREAPLEFAGREFQLPLEGGTGLGKPLKLLAR